MNYDPNHPQNGEVIDADLLRNNMNALDEKITQIPAGPPGPQGPAGDKGDKGDQGDKGDPGDVNTAQMNDTVNNAINGTARNLNGVFGSYGGGFSDPPTKAELDDFAAYLEAFRQALER